MISPPLHPPGLWLRVGHRHSQKRRRLPAHGNLLADLRDSDRHPFAGDHQNRDRFAHALQQINPRACFRLSNLPNLQI